MGSLLRTSNVMIRRDRLAGTGATRSEGMPRLSWAAGSNDAQRQSLSFAARVPACKIDDAAAAAAAAQRPLLRAAAPPDRRVCKVLLIWPPFPVAAAPGTALERRARASRGQPFLPFASGNGARCIRGRCRSHGGSATELRIPQGPAVGKGCLAIPASDPRGPAANGGERLEAAAY